MASGTVWRRRQLTLVIVSRNDDATTRLERVFTLRLWREAGATAIRGSIVEAGSGRRFFFSALADLKDFLALSLLDCE